MDLRYKLGLDGSQFDAQARSSTGLVGKMGAGLAALGAGAAFGSLIRRGFEFNKTMSDSEAAIGKVLSQFQGLDAAASKAQAAKAMRQLIELEPKAAGSLNTLVDGFLATLGASQRAGISVTENIDLVGRFANAMANANIPTEQLAQEMRSVVTATISADSTLANMLGITNEMAKAARDGGRMYQFLVDKIGQVGEAGETAAVIMSSLESAILTDAGEVTKGLFGQALEGAKSLTEALVKNKDEFTRLGEAIALVGREVGKFIAFVNEGVKATSRLAAVAGLMIQDGKSYGEAAAMVRAVADARNDDAAAAENEKTAINAKTKAQQAETAAMLAAADATEKKNRAQREASRIKIEGSTIGEAEAAQQRLDGLRRDALMEEMGLRDKINFLQKELVAAMEDENRLRNDPFGADQVRIIEAETRRVELQREINALKREEDAETRRLAATKAAAVQQDAAGRGRVMGGAGTAGETPERRRILGFSAARGDRARLMGSPGGGGLDRFFAQQNEDSEFDRLQKSEFGSNSLSGRKATPVGSKAAERVGRLMGGAEMSGRVNAATAPASAPEGGKGAKTADPMLAELQGIRQELTRIRTA